MNFSFEKALQIVNEGCLKVYPNGQTVCILCNTGGMNSRNLKSHLKGYSHRSKLNQIQAQMRKANRFQDLCPFIYISVMSIQHDKWKLMMKGHMFDYQECDEASKHTKFREIEALVTKYEQMERLSLLELAIWKSKIISSGEFNSVQDMKEYIVLDKYFDPKAFANDMRMTCGSQVIIPNVMKFL